MLNDKKLSRKEFLAYLFGLIGLFVASRVPKILSSEKVTGKIAGKKSDPHYGNGSYGGTYNS